MIADTTPTGETPAEPFILIVDDCEDAVPALEIALQTFYHCNVRHSPNGAHALATLTNSDQQPLAIITDLNLPDTDGYQLIGSLRGNGQWAHTPIIVISADTHPQTPGRVRELGADAFFSKPYSPAGICQSLERILHAKDEHHTSGDSARSLSRPDRA
jgi:CheY-like chemotaxis protein